MNKLVATLLQLNGWVAALIGSFIVLDPITMLEPYGLQPELTVGLLSELRAPGGLLIGCGLMIVRCSLDSDLYRLGLMTSALVYGSYGGVRLLGFLLDGQPPIEILTAFAIEFVLFALALYSYWRIRQVSGVSIISHQH